MVGNTMIMTVPQLSEAMGVPQPTIRHWCIKGMPHGKLRKPSNNRRVLVAHIDTARWWMGRCQMRYRHPLRVIT